jgi:hypothetical protein
MKVVVAFALSALLVPPVVEAGSSSPAVTINASSKCSALRVEIGASAFGGTFSSFAACVLKLTPLERQNTAAAGTLCRDRFPAANSSLRLFDSCVVIFAKSASLDELQSLNPGQACTLLRSSIGTAAFASKYRGDGKTANAFRKCISRAARVQIAVETSSASTCRAEQEAAGFSSAHGGRTFARFYGTNAADSNAFGRCVSLKTQAEPSSQSGQTSSSTQEQRSTVQPLSTATTTAASTDETTAASTDETSTSTAGQQPTVTPETQSSAPSTTSTTPTSIDACSGGSPLGKPNRLMPSDCLPAGPAEGLR